MKSARLTLAALVVAISVAVIAAGAAATLLGDDVGHGKVLGGDRFDDRTTQGDWLLQSSAQSLKVLTLQSDWEDMQGRLILGDSSTGDAVLVELRATVEETRLSLKPADLQRSDVSNRAEMLYALSQIDVGARRQLEAVAAGNLPAAVDAGAVVAAGFQGLLANANAPRS